MPIDFSLPPLDDPATELLVERYFQPIGADVVPGQPLALVVTERFEWEIPAISGGTISALVTEPGTTVAPGALLLQLTARDATVTPETYHAEPPPVATQRATPLARRMAAAHGLDLASITGSGHGGRITRNDVICLLGDDQPGLGHAAGLNGRNALPQPEEDAQGLAVLSSPRSTNKEQSPLPAPGASPLVSTAAQLPGLDSDLPHAITAVNIDMSAIHTYIEQHAPRLAKRGIVLDMVACVAQAVVGVLQEHRLVHSAWTNEGIILWSGVKLAIMDGRNGTTTPIMIPDAADLNVQGLARQLTQPAPEATGTTPSFSVSFMPTSWWRGGLLTTASTAGLTISTPERRPVVVEQAGIDTIALRLCSLATLTYDARVVDQIQADAFLHDLRQRLEHFGGL